MALHQSIAKADPVHPGCWPAQPTRAPGRRRDHPSRRAGGDARSRGRANGGRSSGTTSESGNPASAAQSGAAPRLDGVKMKVAVQSSTRGFALIIVMLVIVVFSGLAAVFAMSMKVEMQLARNVDSESEMEWLGRSGVELARYVLAQQLNCPNDPYDALNQKWAGGPGGSCSTNGPLADISLDHVQLGRGKFSVKITDLERKVNINFANREIIQQALDSMSVELFTASTILDSIEDWRDPNTSPHPNGSESDYYLHLPQPYIAKDGPFDDISELLLVRGVTPDIYWGPDRTNGAVQPVQSNSPAVTGIPDQGYSSGLADLFNTLGRLQINV